ncbi:MAG: methyl-accepting chemotaxis sensory transducer [Symbiobacteriaceae bacterium]|nr:methyl-accepting chemotaxis sensory transducer [Symbiobacteriaceae bacterium]
MRKLYSLRVYLTVAIVLIVAASSVLTVGLSLRASREAFLGLATRDMEYMADQLAAAVNATAGQSASQAQFASLAGPILRSIMDDYFLENGMTGYATAWTNDGSYLFHPKISDTSTKLASSEQGKAFLEKARAVNFNGTITYDWQNAGESKPRQKIAVLRTVIWQLVLIGVAVILVVVVLAVILASTLTAFVKRFQVALRRVAGGDLTTHSDLKAMMKRKDEFGEMARDLSQMVGGLRSIAGRVTEGAEAILGATAAMAVSSASVSRAAADASQGASHVAHGAAEQARSADEVGRTMHEFAQNISQIASGAVDSSTEVQRASELLDLAATDMDNMAAKAATLAEAARHSAESAEQGTGVVSGTIAGMDRIRHSVGEASHELAGLSKLSAQITEITETISGIADQTSMLALNAAIEAARAGEHGRGFAVVADEVRKLADRSAASARTITDLIARIQNQTARAVAAMESGKLEVDQGSKLVADTGTVLTQILEVAQVTAWEMHAISTLTDQAQKRTQGVVDAFSSLAAVTEENTAATEELSAGTEQVSASVHRIASVAHDGAATTEEVSASIESVTASVNEVARSARDLEQVARVLQKEAARFTL